MYSPLQTPSNLRDDLLHRYRLELQTANDLMRNGKIPKKIVSRDLNGDRAHNVYFVNKKEQDTDLLYK